MNTPKIIAAAISLAIVASTVAMFQASSKVRFANAPAATTAQVDSRPVVQLATVRVFATPLPQVTVGSLAADGNSGASDLGLPSAENASLQTDSPLYMPYYSFATNLRTMIKD